RTDPENYRRSKPENLAMHVATRSPQFLDTTYNIAKGVGETIRNQVISSKGRYCLLPPIWIKNPSGSLISHPLVLSWGSSPRRFNSATTESWTLLFVSQSAIVNEM